MYKEYFGLKENPFSIAPDPRYFYMSKGHSEALAHLVYGVNTDGGFILLTGEVGTGKTTVCRCLLEHLPENTEVAFILNPKLTVEELLATICDEFGISYPEGNKSNKIFVSAINDHLFNAHEMGKRAILILEEAQNLSIDVLEQIRLLTNLETNQRKLLQIVLIGQPELRRLLVHPRLRQLNQRITVRYHLAPLLKEEIPAYVNHRLSVAGHIRGQQFSQKPLSELYR
jgi:general secretion pathway protein A